MVDKNGKILDLGDKVKFLGDDTYVFTIESVDSDGWIWGSDIPLDFIYDGYGHHNFHNPMYCELFNKQSWGNSKIEFRFI